MSIKSTMVTITATMAITTTTTIIITTTITTTATNHSYREPMTAT